MTTTEKIVFGVVMAAFFAVVIAGALIRWRALKKRRDGSENRKSDEIEK